MRRVLTAIGILLCGCSEENAPGSLGNAKLGIAEFRAITTASGVDVVGVDATGTVMAKVQLRTGVVSDVDDEGEGREVTIEISRPGADPYSATYASIGKVPRLYLVPPMEAQAQALLLDSYVAKELSKWNIVPTPAKENEDQIEVDYGHGGSCSSSFDSWLPDCQNTGFTSCCLQHLNAYGNQRQLVVCGNASPNARAERGCYSPPSCSNGTYPDCNTSVALSCPAGTHTFQKTNGKWVCSVDNNGSICALKNVGPLGCANCWGENYNSGLYTTSYNSSTESCSFLFTEGYCGDGSCNANETCGGYGSQGECYQDCGSCCAPCILCPCSGF